MNSLHINGEMYIETESAEKLSIAVLCVIQDIARKHNGILTAEGESFNNSTLIHKTEIIAGDNTTFVLDIYSV